MRRRFIFIVKLVEFIELVFKFLVKQFFQQLFFFKFIFVEFVFFMFLGQHLFVVVF